jgi:transcriptional regulator with GAF, ATPase, and Fis domain
MPLTQVESIARRGTAVDADRLSDATFVGASDAFRYLQFRIEQVAPAAATVLLLGETGTGKTLVAQALHRASANRFGRFVNVNCASIPPTLLESELFGHERGAFTDARTTQVGRVELAHRGTLFLDEVGELPIEAQAKLLRFLQEGQFERLGSHRTVRVDTRVIAATNRDIHEEVRSGRFRRDLYFRLNVFPITVPPLRQRHGDIAILTRHLVGRLAARNGKRIMHIPKEVFEALERYSWPGNVRELENVLERAVITSAGALGLSEPLDADDSGVVPEPAGTTLRDVERGHILRILAARNWRIEGRQGAADILGLKPSTLRSLMHRLNIQRTDVPRSGASGRDRARPGQRLAHTGS